MLATTPCCNDFGDGGSAAAYYRRLFWKINLAEPLLRKDDILHLGSETLDDVSLATALEDNRHWEQARNWARQLEASGGPWKSAVHHVTETQAESMVAEWKEFLWDVPEERIALWGHCQTLVINIPSLLTGSFSLYLKHLLTKIHLWCLVSMNWFPGWVIFPQTCRSFGKDLPARELHELLLLSLQWLSGMITLASPCGRGLCKRIIAVAKAAAILGISFSEAFDKQPIELLQLLSLKAQESFEEAHLLGLLAAHRGGYMDSQKEEGPAPLLWRFSDFLKWAELCPSEQEIGHSLMRLVITGQEVPQPASVLS
ncbi:unnamed protein product [Prunus armeniaca]|uniref:Uncharacterized protein n=1 Tax=Prunus armeniaca TaxID=36596 RepID=A0A6J5WCA7_PRUAR|nr:unnamed protein product [Prunus armeniaca]